MWTESLSRSAGIHEAISSDFKEDQRKELGKCRRERGCKDVARLSAWFVDRNQFIVQSKSLPCLSIGKIALCQVTEAGESPIWAAFASITLFLCVWCVIGRVCFCLAECSSCHLFKGGGV